MEGGQGGGGGPGRRGGVWAERRGRGEGEAYRGVYRTVSGEKSKGESMHTARNRWTPGQAIQSTPPGLAGIEVSIKLKHWPEWVKTAARPSIFCRIYIGDISRQATS